jgi:hypothetical protein
MKHIKNFIEFSNIRESSEFNFNRLNPDSAQMSISVDNPQLSVNAFDKHEDAIRSGVSKINGIINSLSNSSTFRTLKSKLALEDQQIKSLKILRIINADNVNYDIYISFIIGETEYFGVVENILNKDCTLRSEVFTDFTLVQSDEWIIRTKGLIIKYIKNWLYPKNGKYVLLNDHIICYSINTGKMLKLKKDVIIEVIRSHDNKITIKHENEFYNLIGDNFIYFNYWFEITN